jgi:hypothetical protein
VLSVLLCYTDSDYPLGIFWPLCFLFFNDIQILIIHWSTQWPKDTKWVIRICISWKNRQHNGQKIPMDNQNLYIIEEQKTQWPKDTKGVIRICIFYDIQILITPLVSFGHCVVCSSMIYRFWLPLGIFWPLCCLFFYDIQILITPLVSFGHCVFCSSMIYRFWLFLGFFWPLCCNGHKLPRR